MITLNAGNILLNFSPKIQLDISLDVFTFKKNGLSKSFRTYIHVSGDKKPRVVSVGEEPLRPFESIKVDLFDKNAPTEIDKYDCLSAFLKYCIAEMSSKYAMIRPTIVVSGINELNPVLNGYEQKVLMTTLGDAGAALVLFKD